MKTYSEKLKDPRWQRKRLEIMERDTFTCVICGDDKSTLNVHHTYYGKGKLPWDYDIKHLITLCEPCHKQTEIMREEILKEMTWEIPINSIHAIATCGNLRFLSQLSFAFIGSGSKSGMLARARQIREAIKTLEEIAENLESQGGKP
jgi:hypothetical protein